VGGGYAERFNNRFVNFNRRGNEVRMGGYAERAGKHHNINRYRSLAKGSGFKINEVMGDGKGDAFSVVDYGAPIVNIGDRVHRGTGGGLRTVSGHSAL